VNKKRAVAVTTAFVAALSISVASCSWFSKHVTPVVDDAWNCLQQEADAAKGGQNWIELGLAVTIDFVTMVSGGMDPASAVVSLVEKYGAPVVACTLNELRGGTPTQPATPDAGVPGDAGAPPDAGPAPAMTHKPTRVRRLMALPPAVQQAAQMGIDSQHWRYR
jgi:hypothetical protein